MHLKTRMNNFHGFSDDEAWYDIFAKTAAESYDKYLAGQQRKADAAAAAAAASAAAAAAAAAKEPNGGLSTTSMVLLAVMGFLMVFTLMKNR